MNLRRLAVGVALFAWGTAGTLWAAAAFFDVDPRTCLHAPTDTLEVHGVLHELKEVPPITDGREGYRLAITGVSAEPLEVGPTTGPSRLGLRGVPVIVGDAVVVMSAGDRELRVFPKDGGPPRASFPIGEVAKLVAGRASVAWFEERSSGWQVRRLDLDAPSSPRTLASYPEGDARPRDVAIEGRSVAILVGWEGPRDESTVTLHDEDGRTRSWPLDPTFSEPLVALGSRHLYVLGGGSELGYGRGKLLAIARADGATRVLEGADWCGTVLGVLDDDPVILTSATCPGESIGVGERRLVRLRGREGVRQVLYAGWTGMLWPLQMRDGTMLFEERFVATGRCERPVGFPEQKHRFVQVTW